MIRAERIVCAHDGRTVLDGVDIGVDAGEFVALVGPNGAGKSTLLAALSRTHAPIAGIIRLEGRDIYRELTAREAAQRIAVVPQSAAFDFEFTVKEFVLLGRHPHIRPFGRETAADYAAVQTALERTGTWPLRDRLVPLLSGGEQRRVLIARALAQTAPLLILDEPTTHLDLRAQVELLNLVRDQAGATLAVFHDLNLALAYASRAVLLAEGRIFADGPPRAVLDEAHLGAVFGPYVHVRDGAILPRIK